MAPKSNNSQSEAKKGPRKLFKQAVWHPESGLVTNPYMPSLPSNIATTHNSTASEDYLKPRFLTDENIYLACYPTKPIHRSFLFSDLAISNEELQASIVSDTSASGERRFSLHSNIRAKLQRLENSLLCVSETLLAHHPNLLEFPLLKYPRWPNKFGYNDWHRSERHTLTCARRSIAAFPMLVAVVSFTFFLWLGDSEDDCFGSAFAMLAMRRAETLPRVWLNYLQDTIVCSLTPGLRPGGFLDPYSTRWGHVFNRLARASVPIWMIWGHEKTYKTTKLFDRHMVVFFPPDEYIEVVKQRRAAFEQTVLPHETTYHFEGATSTPLLLTSAPPPLTATLLSSTAAPPPSTSTPVDWAPPGSIQPQDNQAAGLDFVDFDQSGTATSEPEIDRTQIVHPDSGQRPGESWDEFATRLEQSLERRIEHETPQEKQKRLDHEKVAEKGPTSKSGVFIWEQDEQILSFYRRTRLRKSDAVFAWNDCSKFQRRYWSHRNEWDLIPHLPLHPPDVPRSEIEEPDLFDDGNEMSYYNSYPSGEEVSTLKMPTKDPVAPIMLETIRDLTLGEDDPLSDAFVPFAISFLEYLRQRHGFSADIAPSWNKDLHEGKFALPKEKWAAAMRNLLFHPLEPPPTEAISTSIVDFHNIGHADYMQYENLPSLWDLSPHSVVPRSLICDMKRLCLQRVATNLPWTSVLYILRPPVGSQDTSPWFIATPSATTVLLIFRSDWNTMYEIGRGLLALGIPFRTVIEKERNPNIDRTRWKYKVRGLGSRPITFIHTEEDFLAYKQACDDVLRSSRGRAIRLQGGIAGRIAREVVSDSLVLDGPLHADLEVVGYHGNINFVDDRAGEEFLDIVCGVYVVDATPGGSVSSHLSWWPKQTTWFAAGLAGDQWLPIAEHWYNKRLSVLSSEARDLCASKKWKQKLKYNRAAHEPIYAASESWARSFLSQDERLR